MMKNILITGATGNVGIEVIKCLSEFSECNVLAGVRNPEKGNDILNAYKLISVKFDFTDPDTYHTALIQCEILFLMRPPQISDVKKYFDPLIRISKEVGIKHIVFLSVQGVEKSTIIPHHKIEKLIVESGIPYTFLRPAYFMQNFTTTLRNDLVTKKQIFLPAGNAKFTLIDVSDIGTVAAIILTHVESYKNLSFELTNTEKLTFKEMAEKLNTQLKTTIHYYSPNLLKFYLTKRKEKLPTMLIFVMIMLHYFPRFQKEPKITNWVEIITLKKPKTFAQFIVENRKFLC
jgi:uncharacterized protein YbjT (DUF2867 family)